MGTPATTETAKLVQFDGTDEMWPAFSIRLDVAIGKLGLDGISSGDTAIGQLKKARQQNGTKTIASCSICLLNVSMTTRSCQSQET